MENHLVLGTCQEAFVDSSWHEFPPPAPLGAPVKFPVKTLWPAGSKWLENLGVDVAVLCYWYRILDGQLWNFSNQPFFLFFSIVDLRSFFFGRKKIYKQHCKRRRSAKNILLKQHAPVKNLPEKLGLPKHSNNKKKKNKNKTKLSSWQKKTSEKTNKTNPQLESSSPSASLQLFLPIHLFPRSLALWSRQAFQHHN